MPRELTLQHLSDEQRHHVCLYLSTGCDRELAARLTRSTLADIHREMSRDPAFAIEVRHAEGVAELAHLRNLQKAAQDVKNWRVSALWLERHSPERFGRRSAGTITSQQLKAFVTHLATVVNEEVWNPADRARLVARLDQIVRELDTLIFDSVGTLREVDGNASTSLATQQEFDKPEVDD